MSSRPEALRAIAAVLDEVGEAVRALARPDDVGPRAAARCVEIADTLRAHADTAASLAARAELDVERNEDGWVADPAPDGTVTGPILGEVEAHRVEPATGVRLAQLPDAEPVGDDQERTSSNTVPFSSRSTNTSQRSSPQR